MHYHFSLFSALLLCICVYCVSETREAIGQIFILYNHNSQRQMNINYNIKKIKINKRRHVKLFISSRTNYIVYVYYAVLTFEQSDSWIFLLTSHEANELLSGALGSNSGCGNDAIILSREQRSGCGYITLRNKSFPRRQRSTGAMLRRRLRRLRCRQ